MSDISFPENQLRFASPELAERIEAEIRAAALVQGTGAPPLRCRILCREWNAPRGRLTIQLGRPGWVTNSYDSTSCESFVEQLPRSASVCALTS